MDTVPMTFDRAPETRWNNRESVFVQFDVARSFGQDHIGTRDMENCAGDWFLLDQEMDKALKFSGYDYQFRTINGGHVAGYMENWREAMAYLWKGWPERVKAGPSAPRAQEILVPGEGWQLVAEGFKSTRGPA